jgi:hypothetical protein
MSFFVLVIAATSAIAIEIMVSCSLTRLMEVRAILYGGAAPENAGRSSQYKGLVDCRKNERFAKRGWNRNRLREEKTNGAKVKGPGWPVAKARLFDFPEHIL